MSTNTPYGEWNNERLLRAFHEAATRVGKGMIAYDPGHEYDIQESAALREEIKRRLTQSENASINAAPQTEAGESNPVYREADQSAVAAPAHTDHPLRHFDRTCPGCLAENSSSDKKHETHLIADKATDAQKARAYEWLRSVALGKEECGKDSRQGLAALALDEWHRLASIPSATGWIPVSERGVPIDGGTYLVVSESGQVCPHIRGIIHNNVGSPWDWKYGEAITHWMPLPDAPRYVGDESK